MSFNISTHWMGNKYQAYFSHNGNLYNIFNHNLYPLLNLSKHQISCLTVIPAPPDLNQKIEEKYQSDNLNKSNNELIDNSFEYSNSLPLRDVNEEHYQLGIYPLVGGIQQNKVKIYSLQLQNWVHEIELEELIEEIQANENVIAIRTKKYLYIFSHMGKNYIDKYELYPEINSMSLSKRWIAFSCNTSVKQNELDFSDYQTAFLKISRNIAQFTTSKLKQISDSIKQNTMDNKDINSSFTHGNGSSRNGGNFHTKYNGSSLEELFESHQPLKHAGTIEIIDIKSRKNIIFRSHKSPVYTLQFDDSGTLLVTSSIRGTDLNVYKISPFIKGEATSRNISHLYTLERGKTIALITSINFSVNSKWVAVGSNHGTSHIYAINPFGGPVSLQTHSELVSKKFNDTSRACCLQQPKRIVLSPTIRIRNVDIDQNAQGEPIFSFFHSFENNSKVKNLPIEYIYLISLNGYAGIFKLNPNDNERDPNLDYNSKNLSVSPNLIHSCKLEEPKSNLTVKWETNISNNQLNEYEKENFKSSESISNNLNSTDYWLDQEGDWISNLELETYNSQNKVWISERLRFIKLSNPIEENNALVPNLDGDKINVQMIQLETPDRPLEWDTSTIRSIADISDNFKHIVLQSSENISSPEIKNYQNNNTPESKNNKTDESLTKVTYQNIIQKASYWGGEGIKGLKNITNYFQNDRISPSQLDPNDSKADNESVLSDNNNSINESENHSNFLVYNNENHTSDNYQKSNGTNSQTDSISYETDSNGIYNSSSKYTSPSSITEEEYLNRIESNTTNQINEYFQSSSNNSPKSPYKNYSSQINSSDDDFDIISNSNEFID